MKAKNKIELFNIEVSDLKRNEQLRFRHRAKTLTTQEVMDGRSNAYTFIDFDKL